MVKLFVEIFDSAMSIGFITTMLYTFILMWTTENGRVSVGEPNLFIRYSEMILAIYIITKTIYKIFLLVKGIIK